jgi:hypothetical protein
MKASSESIAGDRVADGKREEAERNGQHDEVQHFDAPGRLGPRTSVWCDAAPNTGRSRTRDSTAWQIKNAKSDCPDFAAEVPPCLLRYCREDMPFAA